MIFYNIKQHTTIIDLHFDGLNVILKRRINKSSINKHLKEFLNTNLKSILISDQNTLQMLNRRFKSHLNYSPKLDSKIRTIFNYVQFSKKKPGNGYDAYKLASNLNIRTCLYCNRNYTLTVVEPTKKNNKITRPEFDHFFNQAENPLLALSLFNLIPCCKTCNSSLKKVIAFDLDNYLHPYKDNITNHYCYKFNPYDVQAIIGGTSNLGVKIIVTGTSTYMRRKINKIMSAHSEELKDLFEIRYRFSEKYFAELLKKYHNIGLNKDEMYKLVFGVYANESNFSQRPFSKLKKDILTELNIFQ